MRPPTNNCMILCNYVHKNKRKNTRIKSIQFLGVYFNLQYDQTVDCGMCTFQTFNKLNKSCFV